MEDTLSKAGAIHEMPTFRPWSQFGETVYPLDP